MIDIAPRTVSPLTSPAAGRPSRRRSAASAIHPDRLGSSQPPLRVAIVGHLKYPICHPFMGGLERFTSALVKGLQSRGIEVTLFASAGSDPDLGLEAIVPEATVAAGERRFPDADAAADRDAWIERHEDEAYDRLMRRLAREDLAGWFDVIHNNSINPVPIDWADRLSAPCLTTLHVPVLPRLQEQLECGGPRGSFVNISQTNRGVWGDLLPEQTVIPNAVDTTVWKPQPRWRQPRAIWFGRILPDKGTHYAIDAAHKAGLPIDVVGPVNDEAYYRNEVVPRMQPGRGDRLLGAIETDRLAKLVGRASVCLVTPCWEEPFGLVTAEAMSCGTPVAAFRRGGPQEIVSDECGRLAAPDDADALADAVRQCLALDRREVRQCMVDRYDESLMLDRYVAQYESLAQRASRRTETPAVSGGLARQTALA